MDEIDVLLSMHGEQVHRDDCYTLLQDFFEGIDKTIAAIEGK
ncbi:hypothetical protein [Vibrio sp.]